MSTKTGVAPVRATALAVAANVNDGTMTSSPAPMPAADRPRCRLGGELRLERSDLRSLRDTAAPENGVDSRPLLLADQWLGDRDLVAHRDSSLLCSLVLLSMSGTRVSSSRWV